jgi:hypothetical protein
MPGVGVSPVYRMPLAAHIALIDPGFYFNLSPSTTASISYSRQFSDNVSDNDVEQLGRPLSRQKAPAQGRRESAGA